MGGGGREGRDEQAGLNSGGEGQQSTSDERTKHDIEQRCAV